MNGGVLIPVRWAGLVVLLGSFAWAVGAEPNLPTAQSVLQRVLRRAQAVAKEDEESKYTYEKRSVFEDLDDTGKPTRTVEKLYLVQPIQGVPFSRLIRIQNRELTQPERQAQDKREADFRRKLGQKQSQAIAPEDEDALSAQLLGRYDFRVEKREQWDHRPVLVLAFQPKPGHHGEKSMEDKVLDRLAGRAWIDEAEAEVARVQVGLTEDLSLGWFGLIASLKQCDVKIERQRLPDGTWVAKSFVVSLNGRKVLAPMRSRTLVESFHFRKP